MLIDAIGSNHSKLADLEFYQWHIQIYQFQFRCGILDQNDEELKLLQILALI